jgi:chemosensory pili system protein ChpA (sensor histidine kinase/response regulator)
MWKVLVVDDADDVRFLLARLLRLGGYATATAPDGMAALGEMDRAKPDLVVLDLMMPRMNGVDMLAALREDPRFRDLPVLLYTAVSSGRMIDDCERLGIQGRITKGSAESTHILDRIEQLLRDGHSPPPPASTSARWQGPMDTPPSW